MKQPVSVRTVSAKRALGTMNRELAERCTAIAAMLTEAGANDVSARYKIGQEISRVMADPGTYGTKAVMLLASGLGRKTSSLYGYAGVAKAWSPAELKLLMRRKNHFGVGLTFSHLLVLASARETERANWTEKTLSEGWSSRELRGHILSARGVRSARPPNALAAFSVVRLPMARALLSRNFGEDARPELMKAIEAQDRLAAIARQNAADLREAVAALDGSRELSVLAG